jgi:hypothetical protein
MSATAEPIVVAVQNSPTVSISEPIPRECDQIAEIAAALAKACATLENPPRNRTVRVGTKAGGSYTYAYATLDAVLDEVRPKLAAVGISLLQPIVWRGEKPWLVTRLLHSSGQAIETELPLVIEGDGRLSGPQAFGSTLTYMRRYGIESLLPIAAEYDDDGSAASGREVSSKEDLPACPKCGKNSKVIPSKLPKTDGELYCLGCKAGFVPATREPGEDDAPPLGHGQNDFEPVARIPEPRSPDYRSPAALGKELLRLTGDKDASMALLSELSGASTLAGMPPNEVGPVWARLAKHPKWGKP